MMKDRKTIFQWACGIFGLCAFGIFILGFATLLYHRWDSKVNEGHEYGYYGEFNTVSNALEALPGVTIVDSGYNADVFLEEFMFSVVTGDERELKIWFNEDEPIRVLSGENLASALKQRIEKELSNRIIPTDLTARTEVVSLAPAMLNAERVLPLLRQFKPELGMAYIATVLGEPGVDVGSARQDLFYKLDDSSSVRVRATYQGIVHSIERQGGSMEALVETIYKMKRILTPQTPKPPPHPFPIPDPIHPTIPGTPTPLVGYPRLKGAPEVLED